jgi:hypothetical protein
MLELVRDCRTFHKITGIRGNLKDESIQKWLQTQNESPLAYEKVSFVFKNNNYLVGNGQLFAFMRWLVCWNIHIGHR